MTCDMCAGRGFVYVARIEGGRAMWNEPPQRMECPQCHIDKLTGTTG